MFRAVDHLFQPTMEAYQSLLFKGQLNAVCYLLLQVVLKGLCTSQLKQPLRNTIITAFSETVSPPSTSCTGTASCPDFPVLCFFLQSLLDSTVPSP